MQPDDLIDRLVQYRLDRRLAELHYHLSRLGGARASEVARASNRKRTDVYKDLEALVGRRFATKTLERPARYVPKPLTEVLAIVLEEGREEMGMLGDQATSLARAWPSAASRLEASAAQYAVLQGMTQVKGCLEHLVAGAREDILVVGPPRFVAKLRAAGILDALARRAKEGINVRILTALDKADPFLVQLSQGCQMRHLHVPAHAGAVCADAQAVALLVSSGKTASLQGMQETVLLVESADFVLGQRALLDAFWQRGVDAHARWTELGEGRAAPRLEVVRGSRLVTDLVCAMAARAQRLLEVEAHVGPGMAWAGALASAARDAAARGVQVHASGMATASSGSAQSLSGLGAHLLVQADVAPRPTEATPPDGRCQVTVEVDGAEFAFAWRPDAGTAGGDGPECWAIWTNDVTLGRRLGFAEAAPQTVRLRHA